MNPHELYPDIFDYFYKTNTMIKSISRVLLFLLLGTSAMAQNKHLSRYIIIEAPCLQTFPAQPGYAHKVILAGVFKKQFENEFEMVNAEPDIISDFEVALEKKYPGSRNQVKDILVYMLNTEKEAKNLYNRKIKHFKILDTAIIPLKIKP